MKIFYISGSKIPSKTANSIHVMKMAQAMAEMGYDITLFAKKNDFDYSNNAKDIFDYYNVKKIFKLELIKVWVQRGNGLYYAVSVILKILFSDKKSTLVYGRDFYSIFFAGLLGYKIIFESHAYYYSKKRKFIENKIFNSKYFIKLIVISEELKKTYEQNFQSIKKIEVHHDGADIINDLDTEMIWENRNNRIQVGYIGHLYKGRGIDIILKCSEKLPDIDFNIIGGNEEDIRYWDKNSSPNLFFYGFVSQKSIPRFLKSSDILLMPYQKEVGVADSNYSTANWMSPLKLFEYMSSQRVIISSDLPILREILNESNSILVDPTNIDEWINAIKLLKDSNLRKSLAEKAYKDFLENYTWGKRAKNILHSI